MGWVVEGTQTHGPEKGELLRAVIESDEKLTEEQALWFGAGQLRGMGFPVKDVCVRPAPLNVTSNLEDPPPSGELTNEQALAAEERMEKAQQVGEGPAAP